MAQPSTPNTSTNGARSNFVGKIFSKLRTPSGASGSPYAHSPNNTSGRSSPALSLSSLSLGRRNSSRSSFHCSGSTDDLSLGGGSPLALALRGTEGDDDEEMDELALPEFESEVLKNFMHRSTNATTTTTDRPSFDQRRHSPPATLPSTSATTAKSTFLSRNNFARGLKGRSKSKTRTAGAGGASASEAESEGEAQAGEEEDATARAMDRGTASAESYKSPAFLSSSQSLSQSQPLGRSLRSTTTAPSLPTGTAAPSSSAHETTTPHLPRAGLSSSTNTKPSSTWLERTARSGAAREQDGAEGATGGAGTRRPVRRAQRAPPPPPAAEPSPEPATEQTQESARLPASLFESSPPPLASSQRRPPASPISHGRSRSELPPSSPRHEGAIAAQSSAERAAATLTIGVGAGSVGGISAAGTMSREGYARRNLVSRERDGQRSSSALGHYPSSRTSPPALDLEFGAIPPRPASSLAGSLGRSQRERGGPPPASSNPSHQQQGLQSSAALRQRMLYSSSSSSSATAPPPLATETPSPPLSSTSSNSFRLGSASSSSAGSAPGSQDHPAQQQRRTAVLEETASRLSRSHSQTQEDRGGAVVAGSTSPNLVPYAKRLSLSTTSSQPVALGRSGSLSRTPSSEDATATATAMPRPESSTAMYRDPPSALPTSLSSSSTREPSPTSSATIQPQQPQGHGQEARPRLGQSGSFLLQQRERERAMRERQAQEQEEREREREREEQGYGDENAYQAPHSTVGGGLGGARTPLAETYRSASNPLPLATHQREQQGWPKDRQQPQRPSPPPQQQEYSMPPPLAPSYPHLQPQHGAATPSMTHQQLHYTSQPLAHPQQQQQYQPIPQPYQLPGQQTPLYAPQHQQQQGQQMAQQQGQQEYQVPLQKSGKKGPAVIVVNGKPYARAGILGKGGSSRVYRVLDEKNNLFAIKKVDISKNDAESRASFINEIALLERLRGNAQIIRLVDSEINDQKKVLLMVMEVGETDLNNLLIEHSGKAISMNFIRYIWEQMLEAVQVIHDENVVHTDLKPANFVLVKGRLKLIDFGISKAIANDTTNIGRDQQIGTANYMPPEALIDSGLGRDGKRLMKLGRAADVWSLGCILHQMVYGRTPFSHLRDVSHKIMAIQNPRHVIQFADFSCPVDERGEQKKGMEVKVGEEVKETMRSCLRFDQRKRMTIPELLVAPFLRGEGKREVADSVEEKKSNLPTIDETTMNALLTRVSKMLTGEPLDSAQGQLLARKLMNELRATQASV